jgi:hypothetical protein
LLKVSGGSVAAPWCWLGIMTKVLCFQTDFNSPCLSFKSTSTAPALMNMHAGLYAFSITATREVFFVTMVTPWWATFTH